MSAAKMTEVPRDELESLVAALDLKSRADLAKLFGLKAVGAVNSWFRKEWIPQQRLDVLAVKFAGTIRGKKELNHNEQKAKSFLEEKYATPLSVMISIGIASKNLGRPIKLVLRKDAANQVANAQGSALTSQNSGSALSSDEEDENLYEEHKPEAELEKLTLNQLVEEIEKRGWSVQLGLKIKPS